MKYYDMWVVHTNGNIRFYDGTDGTLINNLILEHCNGAEVAKVRIVMIYKSYRLIMRVVKRWSIGGGSSSTKV
jgi:hypothetical protein